MSHRTGVPGRRVLVKVVLLAALLAIGPGLVGGDSAEAQSSGPAFDPAPKWTGELYARAYSGQGRTAGDDTTGLLSNLDLLASEPEDLYETDVYTGAYTSVHASWAGFNTGGGQENANDDLIMGLFERDGATYAVSEWGRVYVIDSGGDGWDLQGDFGDSFNDSNPLTGAFTTPDGRLYITYDRSSGPTIREVDDTHVEGGSVSAQSLLGDHISFGSGAAGAEIAGLAEHGGWMYMVSRGTSSTPPTLYSFKVRNQDGNNEIRNLVEHGPIEGLPTPSGQRYPQAGALEVYNGKLFLGMRNDSRLYQVHSCEGFWCGTLDSESATGYVGYLSPNTGSLSDTTLPWNGQNYTIDAVLDTAEPDAGFRRLHVMFQQNVGQADLDGLALQIEGRTFAFTDAEYGPTNVTGSSRTSFSFRYHGDDYGAFPVLEGNATNPRTYVLSILDPDTGYDPFYGTPLGNEPPAWTQSSLSEEYDPDNCRSFTAGFDYTDENRGDVLEFWLGGQDSWAFTVDQSTGEICPASGVTIDLPVYNFAMVVTDNRGGRDTMDVEFTRETRTGITATPALSVTGPASSGSIDENYRDYIARLSITDGDGESDHLTVTLKGDDAGKFVVAGNREIHLAPGEILNFESKTSYDLTVRVEDSAGASVEVDIDFTVTDVDEPPPGPPTGLWVRGRSPGLMAASYNRVNPPDGTPTIKYEFRRRETGSTWEPPADYRSTTHCCTLDLSVDTSQGGRNYDIQIRTINDEGESPWSDIVTFRSGISFGLTAVPNPVSEGSNQAVQIESRAYGAWQAGATHDVVVTVEPVYPATESDFTVLENTGFFQDPGRVSAGEGTVTIQVHPNFDDTPDRQLKISGTTVDGHIVESAYLTITDDDDVSTLNIMASRSNLTLDEGASDTYQVRLSQQPTDTVTVSVVGSGAAVSAVSPATLTFTTDDWDVPQEVTVTATADRKANRSPVTGTVTISAPEGVIPVGGGNYGSLSAATWVYRADDDYTPLAFDHADVSDLYFVRESGADGDPTGLPVATGGYEPISYTLVRASDRAAVGSWVSYTPGITSITPELGSYRNLEVLYTATDWNSDTDSVTFYINVGPPTPYPVTTHSGGDQITVQVPTDDIPASHDVQLRHSSDGGATYGSWADATMTEVDTLSTTVVTGLSAGAERYFQLRYCVDSSGTVYCGGPSRAAYGRVQDPDNAPTFASNQATTLTLTNSELVPDVEYLTVTATDPDGGDVTYTATVVDSGSNAVDYFMIDRHTGGISVTPRQGSGFISNNAFAPSTYTMTVTATASDGDRATIDVTITTANDPTGTPGQAPGFFLNDLPSQKTISQKDLHPAYLVATGRAADPQGDTVLFGLLHTSTFTNNFVINRTNGRITIRPGARFIPGESYQASPVVTDGNRNFGYWNLNISITSDSFSANDQSPVFDPNLFNTRHIPESVGAGTSLGSVTATDPQGDQVTYTQRHDSAHGHFALDSSTGEVTVQYGAEFAVGETHSVIVVASDPDGNRSSFTLDVEVVFDPPPSEDKPEPAPNEAPVFGSDVAATVEVQEQYAKEPGYIVATVSATDPDGDPVTYSRHTDSTSAFRVDPSSGVITVRDSRTLALGQSYPVTVVATDDRGSSSQHTVTVTVVENQPGSKEPDPQPGPPPGHPPPSPRPSKPEDTPPPPGPPPFKPEDGRPPPPPGPPGPPGPPPPPSESAQTGDCPSGSNPFGDVGTDHWAADAIGCLYGLGVTAGTTADTYAPDEPVTRVQMAVFLTRMWQTAGWSCGTGTAPFGDVGADHWAADAVDCLYGLGVTTGTTGGNYAPDESITRAQMAVFLVRLLQAAGGTCPGGSNPFSDVGADHWAADAVNCLYWLGVTSGTTASTYAPDEPVTRAQMAVFLARLWPILEQNNN